MTGTTPVLLSDPRVAAISWADNAEPLVDLRRVGGLRVDQRLADPGGDYAHLRRGVAERLLRAQAALPDGLALLVVEGYRPPDLQESYFAEYRAELAIAHPAWDAQRLYIETSKYISPPGVAPHGTGGAVDLTLCSADGRELDMGTALNASPQASDNACFTAAPGISPVAMANRRILVDALTAVGLVNYPTEWWHWSWGERYWAWNNRRDVTAYAPVSRCRSEIGA